MQRRSRIEVIVVYVVCAHLTGKAAELIVDGQCDFYLDSEGRWSARENARRFATRAEAEAAMQAKRGEMHSPHSPPVAELSIVRLE